MIVFFFYSSCSFVIIQIFFSKNHIISLCHLLLVLGNYHYVICQGIVSYVMSIFHLSGHCHLSGHYVMSLCHLSGHCVICQVIVTSVRSLCHLSGHCDICQVIVSTVRSLCHLSSHCAICQVIVSSVRSLCHL